MISLSSANRTLSLAVAALAASALPLSSAAGQGARASAPAAEWSYGFRVATGDGDTVVGVTHVSGDRSRIEVVESGSRRGANVGGAGRGGTYLLVGEGGRTLFAVDPRDRSYTRIGTEEFSRIVGTAMSAVSRVVQMDVRSLDVTGARLGPGEEIAGQPTQRGQLVQEFTVRVGALGFSTDMSHRIETEYWVAPGLALPRNPLLEMFAGLPAVMAQQSEDFLTRSAAGHRALVGNGTPMRMVITAYEREESADSRRSARRQARQRDRAEAKSTVIEVTSVERARHDESLFEVPAGFRLKEGFNWSSGR